MTNRPWDPLVAAWGLDFLYLASPRCHAALKARREWGLLKNPKISSAHQWFMTNIMYNIVFLVRCKRFLVHGKIFSPRDAKSNPNMHTGLLYISSLDLVLE